MLQRETHHLSRFQLPVMMGLGSNSEVKHIDKKTGNCFAYFRFRPYSPFLVSCMCMWNTVYAFDFRLINSLEVNAIKI